MATLEPVDFNPFEEKAGPDGTVLEPVDFNPFEEQGAQTSTLGGTEREGFGSETIRGIGERAEKVMSFAERQQEDRDGVKDLQVGLVAAGQVAGAVTDIVEGVASAVFDLPILEPAKEKLSEGLQYIASTDAGKAGLEAFQNKAEDWKEFKKENPDVALQIESTMNIALLGLEFVGGREVKRATGDIHEIYQRRRGGLEREYDEAAADAIVAMAPTQKFFNTKRGKKGFDIAQADVKEGLKAIVQHKDELLDANGLPVKIKDFDGVDVDLPTDLYSWSDGIQKTKQSIYRQYTDLASDASAQGATVDMGAIAGRVEDWVRKNGKDHGTKDMKYLDGHFSHGPESANWVNKKNGVANSPDDPRFVSPGDVVKSSELDQTMRHAIDTIGELRFSGRSSLVDAQSAVERINARIMAKSTQDAPKLQGPGFVDEIVSKDIRASIDNTIETFGGEASMWQPLRDQYRSLKKIEEHVAKRMAIEAKSLKTGGVVPDLSNTFGDASLLAGLVSQNWGQALFGASAKAISLQKRLKGDPNRRTRKLFEKLGKVDDLEKKFSRPMTPSSLTGKMVKMFKDKGVEAPEWVSEKISEAKTKKLEGKRLENWTNSVTENLQRELIALGHKTKDVEKMTPDNMVELMRLSVPDQKALPEKVARGPLGVTVDEATSAKALEQQALRGGLKIKGGQKFEGTHKPSKSELQRLKEQQVQADALNAGDPVREAVGFLRRR